MSKDPAFLFYSSDFLVGTAFFSDEQAGKYIRLLCYQHQKGHLSEKDMLKICNSYDEDIFSKFDVDADGNYFNSRLDLEIQRRNRYSISRSINRANKATTTKSSNDSHSDVSNICSTHDEHMETEDESISKKRGVGKGVSKTIPKDVPDWHDWNVYLKMAKEAWSQLRSDNQFISKMEYYHPEIDVVKSIDKTFDEFYVLEDGWEYKKKRKSNTINWKSTITKALNFSYNTVRKTSFAR